MAILEQIRTACEEVAGRARSVTIDERALPALAARLAELPAPPADPSIAVLEGPLEQRAAYCLTIGAINFGSGWFPTLRKLPGASGAITIARGVRARFAEQGAWSAAQLARIEAADVAQATGQDPGHELIGLYTEALRSLGRRVEAEAGGDWLGVARGGDGTAEALVARLAGWECFRDSSRHGKLEVPFLKRAQLTTADLARCGAAELSGLGRLTLFADNLVPHVLRLEGALRYEPRLERRIDTGELIEHGSPAEVEIRACALTAVERLVALGAGPSAQELDALLWRRGQEPRLKERPRHRTRCTAY